MRINNPKSHVNAHVLLMLACELGAGLDWAAAVVENVDVFLLHFRMRINPDALARCMHVQGFS